MRELFTREELSDILELPQRDLNRQLEKVEPSIPKDGLYSFGTIYAIAKAMTKTKKKEKFSYSRPEPRCLECLDLPTKRKNYVISVSSIDAILKLSQVLEVPAETTPLSRYPSGGGDCSVEHELDVRIKLPDLDPRRTWPKGYRPGNFITFRRRQFYQLDSTREIPEKQEEIANMLRVHNSQFEMTPPPEAYRNDPAAGR
jgi:hypothetical protein